MRMPRRTSTTHRWITLSSRSLSPARCTTTLAAPTSARWWTCTVSGAAPSLTPLSCCCHPPPQALLLTLFLPPLSSCPSDCGGPQTHHHRHWLRRDTDVRVVRQPATDPHLDQKGVQHGRVWWLGWGGGPGGPRAPSLMPPWHLPSGPEQQQPAVPEVCHTSRRRAVRLQSHRPPHRRG